MLLYNHKLLSYLSFDTNFSSLGFFVVEIRRTRASHELQYTRQFAYSDALKNSFFPRTISVWNSLPSSVVSSKTIEEFKASI